MSNLDQKTYWTDTVGPFWAAEHVRLDHSMAPIRDALFEHARPAAGERVLDVGCGAGASTVEAAVRVGAGGRVLAVDLSPRLLAVTAERVAGAGLLDRVELREADAESAALPGGQDLVLSQLGVMFFADPVAAFANLRAATADGGRLAFSCWQPMALNEWSTLPLAAVAEVMPVAAHDPTAPGPYALGDQDRLCDVLRRAGWRSVELHDMTFAMVFATGPDDATAAAEAADLLCRLGPAAAAMRTAADDTVRHRIAQRLQQLARAQVRAGKVAFGGAARIVTARPR